MLNGQIGVDRIVVSGFRIVGVDVQKVLNYRNNEYVPAAEGEFSYLLPDGGGFKRLKIIDNNKFGTLLAASKLFGRKKIDYVRLDMMVPAGKFGNLNNMSMREYQQYIQKVFSYIEEKYGISVDSSVVAISEMEINCTFETKEEFCRYHRVLRLILYNLPKTYKKIVEYSRREKALRAIQNETFYSGNDRIELKIYDKRRQLKEHLGIELGKECMRFEVVLKKTAKVKEVFGTNCLWDITQEAIENFFFSYIQKNIADMYNDWKKYNQSVLCAIIRKYRRKYPSNWIFRLLDSCRNDEQKKQIPVLLDIQNLFDAVKKEDGNRHYARTCKSIRNACLENDVFLQKDAEKITEIFTAIEKQYRSNDAAS